MANICDTTYVFRGSEKDIKELGDFLIKVTKKEEENAKKEKRTAYQWVGNLLQEMGWYDEKTTYCRGEIIFLDCGTDNIVMDVESAWGRIPEIELAIADFFPDIEVYFLEEEFGCGIYCTNDFDGVEFNNKFVLDFADDTMYIETEKELVDCVNDYYKEYWNYILERAGRDMDEAEDDDERDAVEENVVNTASEFFGMCTCDSLEEVRGFINGFDFSRLTENLADVKLRVNRSNGEEFGYVNLFELTYE